LNVQERGKIIKSKEGISVYYAFLQQIPSRPCLTPSRSCGSCNEYEEGLQQVVSIRDTAVRSKCAVSSKTQTRFHHS